MRVGVAVLRWILKKMGAWAAAGALFSLFEGDSGALRQSIKKAVDIAARDIAREKVGVELSEDDPLSDASISAALTTKSGIKITTVRDADVLSRDLAAHASGLVAQKTGVTLTNLLSAEQVKADLVGHVHGVVQQQTGLELVGATTLDEVKSRITKHVETRIVNLVVKHIERAAAEFSNPEATVDELLTMVYRGSEAKNLKASGVALGVAAGVVVAAYARMSAPIKRKAAAFRRRAQNREAQRRFRQRHGNRMRYDKLPKTDEGG